MKTLWRHPARPEGFLCFEHDLDRLFASAYNTCADKPNEIISSECACRRRIGRPEIRLPLVDREHPLQADELARVVVIGVCMGADRIRPAMAINKEIDLRFVIGYTPLEFRDALHMLAEGEVDPRPLITGTVGLDGVEGAFAALGDPEAHAKILIDPRA
jgi:hypothetical protein